jgi:peptidoglycan L-alanyl-D-glutamate endopeptidase CwlK
MITHTVRKGDTLGRIASRYYGDASRYPLIVAANRIQDPDRLTAGMKLSIPEVTVVQAGLAGAEPPVAADPGARLQRLNEERLARLHPVVRIRGRAMLDLCAHAGLSLLVTQGLRTWAEQDALYARGRSVPPKGAIVTNARGGRSYHNFGLAFDVVVLDSVGKADWNPDHPGWAKAGQAGSSVGLEWGGAWKRFRDLPHFQYTGGLTLARCREIYKSGLDSLWLKIA